MHIWVETTNHFHPAYSGPTCVIPYMLIGACPLVFFRLELDGTFPTGSPIFSLA